MLNKEKNKKILTEILSFLIPVALAAIAYFMNGIYPGGKYTVLTYDLRAQVLPMYSYLSGDCPGYDNFFYSMSGGLGGNFFSSFLLYYSPTDFIYSFIPVSILPDAIYFITVIKIGLCGFFFSCFLCRNKNIELPGYMIVVLSCCYALMSFNLIYSMTPIWYDSVMLLPLLALFTDRIVTRKYSPAFIFTMALCIINYFYFAYMNAIAITLYFIFRETEECRRIKEILKDLVVFAVHGIISAGISCIVLIPVIADFSRGKLASVDENPVFINNSIFDVIRMMLPQSYSNIATGSAPNIFCGTMILLFFLLWLLKKGDHKRAKITSIIIFCIYMFSFIFGPADRIWHGFRDPIGFACRYSYTFVFFLICFAARGGATLRKIKEKTSALSLLCTILIIYTFFELFLNGSFLISKIHTDYGYVLQNEYERSCDLVRTGFADYDKDNYSRLEKNFGFTSWDGELMGYDGLEMFSSSYNDSVIRFLYNLGVDAYNNHISSTGLTPPVADFLDIGYYLSYNSDHSDYYDEYQQYKNYYMFKNQDVLPLGILLPVKDEPNVPQFTSNPFENINVLISDVSGIDKDIFVDCAYELTDNTESDGRVYVTITPDKDGHYWFYRSVPYPGEYNDNDPNLNYHRVLSCYLEDEWVGDYGQFGYRYCSDLGFLEKDREYTFSLDSPYTSSGELFLAYLDMESLHEMTGNVKGLEISHIGNDGIVLTGNVDKDTDLILSLPYEKGYRIIVNGEKTDYYDYRGALLRIPVKAGSDTVEITFFPPGLSCGIIVSLLSLSIVILSAVVLKSKKIHEES